MTRMVKNIGCRITRAAIGATMVGLALASAHAYAGQDFSQTLLKGLLVGGARHGVIYLEPNLKPALFQNAKVEKQRWAVWEAFFDRAMRDYPSDLSERVAKFGNLPGSPYRGTVYPQSDLAYVASAVDIQVGGRFAIRTPAGQGMATIRGFQIHFDDVHNWRQLYAIAKPDSGFTVPDTDLLVAAPSIPCSGRCPNSIVSPSAALLSRIQTVVRQGAKVPPHENRIEEIIALAGHFTRRDRSQYVVYARFGPTDPDNLKGHWRTVVLDTDLSIIATLGENEYSHIMPRSVGDVNGDGLDEIWADLVGYEGSNTGLLYWRPRERSFDVIAPTYFGL